jgi:hypothetical protein
MSNKIIITGKIKFEPINKTKKHESQANWKRIAMIFFDGDLSDYYAWFINKRYNLELVKPLRGAHISFINDNIRDMVKNINGGEFEANIAWNKAKNKWDGVTIPITLDLNPKTNDKHWWLNIPVDACQQLDSIRHEVNLGPPNFRYHMTIGYVNEKNVQHSKYIHSLIKNGLIK